MKIKVKGRKNALREKTNKNLYVINNNHYRRIGGDGEVL